MKLAAFKRSVRYGQRVTVVNNLHPHLSGERTVAKVQTRNLATRAEDGTLWWTDWPKASLARIEGNTLHFLHDNDPDRVTFSYTFHVSDEKPQPAEMPAATEDAAETPAKPEQLLVAYRVSWEHTGKNLPGSTATVVVDETELRSGDWDARLHTMRRMLANRYLPIGDMDPENVTILDAHPLCNCEPYPIPKNCTYAEHKGHRFHITSSTKSGYEVIRDRHRDKILGTVGIGLSVEFLTLVQRKYGHQ